MFVDSFHLFTLFHSPQTPPAGGSHVRMSSFFALFIAASATCTSHRPTPYCSRIYITSTTTRRLLLLSLVLSLSPSVYFIPVVILLLLLLPTTLPYSYGLCCCVYFPTLLLLLLLLADILPMLLPYAC